MKYYKKLVEKLEKVLTPSDYEIMADYTYDNRILYLEDMIGLVIRGESKDFIQDVVLNKTKYMTEICCQWAKLHKELTAEQKFLVIINLYRTYTLDEEGYKVEDTPETFFKYLNDGSLLTRRTNSKCKISSFMNCMPKVDDNDVIFWLQHEWKDLSGDWITVIRSGNYISKNSREFTVRHYLAFNIFYKEVFGKDIKCIDEMKAKDSLKVMDNLKKLADEME